ncbi:Rrf2 family transcriptional regulator [Sediminimonas qiaohouensis]|uniref:Rrf2 family transcriptional regulator n=1 Tax=Sediminimonas qiaohouensis TaxID=552061 RepID=UPI00040E53C8|nr:Rrf2 family transcriptional regulator [Sediminimonas qiaohouensis]
MRLTSFTDYGLRALMRMAANPERAFSTAELAQEFEISRNHLAKVISALAGAGIVRTRRGGGGGASLAQPAENLRLGKIVRVLEADQALVECFGPGNTCVLTPRCRLKSRLARAEAAFLSDLDQSTLADCIYRPNTDRIQP